MDKCPNCGYEIPPECPPEPPVGTWVKDRQGSVSVRRVSGGIDGWAPPNMMPFGKWQAMWNAHGPLVVCGPYGAELVN